MPDLLTTFASALVKYRHVLLATTVVSAIALPQIVSAYDGTSRILLAETQDPKKKKEAPKAPPPKQVQPPPKQLPPPAQKQVQPPPKQVPQQKQVQPPPKQLPQQKQVQPPPKQLPPPVQKQVQPPPKQEPKTVTPPPKLAPTPDSKTVTPQPKLAPTPDSKTVTPQPKLAPAPDSKTVTPQPKLAPAPDSKTVTPQPKLAPTPDSKTVTPQPKLAPTPDSKTVTPQPKLAPTQDPKTVAPAQTFDPKRTVVQPKTAQPPIQPQAFGAPKAPATTVRSVNEIQGKRKEQREGNRVVIVEPGNRRMFREGNRLYIRHDEGARMRRWGNARFETRGAERYTIVHRGSYDIVTITDSRGHLLRRYRRFPDGREYALIDNRRRFGVGAAVVGGVVLLGLAAPLITLPRDRYIVAVDQAPPVLLYETLEAPPLVPIERAYSLDEIRDNVELRDRVRSVDINTINFSTGSWEISPDQIPQLQALAAAMLRVIEENPSTVFMLEGHTDAVGSAEDNMSLSDRRAEAVAEILTSNFNVPPENLVTQGYGEQHLRVQTDGPSRENRRVQVRNITGLMAADGQPGGGPPGGPPPGQPPG